MNKNEMELTNEQKEFLETINGQEIQLCPYGSVGISGNNFVYAGVKHEIGSSNFIYIKEAYLMTEYGTTDMETIIAMEGF